MDIGSIFQAGADTFDTAVNWLMYGQEKQILDQYRQEDLALAEILRKDQKERDRIVFGFKEQELELSENVFNFGKQKWGQEFSFSKQQVREQNKRQKKMDKQNEKMLDIQIKQNSLDKMGNEIVQAANRDQNLKDTLLTRYGV